MSSILIKHKSGQPMHITCHAAAPSLLIEGTFFIHRYPNQKVWFYYVLLAASQPATECCKISHVWRLWYAACCYLFHGRALLSHGRACTKLFHMPRLTPASRLRSLSWCYLPYPSLEPWKIQLVHGSDSGRSREGPWTQVYGWWGPLRFESCLPLLKQHDSPRVTWWIMTNLRLLDN